MNRRFRRTALLAFACLLAATAPAHAESFDVVVYGGTSGGVAAAVQAARMGKSVVLIEPGNHLGGLTSGGLGATDIGNKGAIGGISREFYRRVGRHYGKDEAWTFEPHVAERIMDELVRVAKVEVVRNERLDLSGGVKKQGLRIQSVRMESGREYSGRVFIDASYEGDLMARAGVSYHVGREANADYDETLDGVQLGSKKHQFNAPVDPYVVPGDPESGLLPGVHPGGPGEQGQGDRRVQAYNFRMCMTDDAANRLPFPKPAGYDPLRYELLRRYIDAGVFDALGSNLPMPNRKTDTNNNGAFSTDNIGMNYDYPDGDYATREKIFAEHVAYQQGMMWFLANDPRLPQKVRDYVNRWGLCKDEFAETGGWSHQMYIREARRMISDYVMTQHHCQGRQVAEDSIGLAAYGMDSHNTQRYVKDGHAINEGDVQVHGFTPYPVAYRSIAPKAAECDNLLVPVCLSATHIAYGSIRMEPVFMVLGQSAATAACQAIDADAAVQKIDIGKLRERLLADQQVLAWTGPPVAHGLDPAKLPGVVVDDVKAERIGEWTESGSTPGFIGAGYLHDANERQGEKQVRYTLVAPKPGDYDVRMSYTTHANRATNALVTIAAGAETRTMKINQRQAPPIDKRFISLGRLHLSAGEKAIVTISNRGADGFVIADAVQLLPSDLVPPEEVRQAVLRGLQIASTAAENYPNHQTCFSCHHQTLPMLALVTARDRKLAVDEKLLSAQADFTLAAFRENLDDLKQGKGVGGRAMTVGYGLWALRLAESKPGETTEAMATYLLKTQHDDGHWSKQTSRPPLEESNISCTVLAAYGLQKFAAEVQRGEAAAALDKAKRWLAAAKLESQEDRVSRLWAVHLLGEEVGPSQSAREQVLAAQRNDGGWGQLDEMPSDAYATGQTLFVLQATGLGTSTAAYRRGMSFLLHSQCEDGSWFVATRSKPVQPYFDNGDPHGKNQFISIPATAWAVAALAAGIEQVEAVP